MLQKGKREITGKDFDCNGNIIKDLSKVKSPYVQQVFQDLLDKMSINPKFVIPEECIVKH